MLSRKLTALCPVDHVPELEVGHCVVAAMVMIETSMRGSMPLLAEDPDRRAKFLVEFSFSVIAELSASPNSE